LPFPSDPCLRLSRAIVGTVFDSGTGKNCSAQSRRQLFARTPPSRPRASPRSRASACDLRDARRPMSTSSFQRCGVGLEGGLVFALMNTWKATVRLSSSRLQARPRRHCVEAQGFRLPLWPLARLAQNEEHGCAGRQAGSGRRLGQMRDEAAQPEGCRRSGQLVSTGVLWRKASSSICLTRKSATSASFPFHALLACLSQLAAGVMRRNF
jgi:hypothetical protein